MEKGKAKKKFYKCLCLFNQILVSFEHFLQFFEVLCVTLNTFCYNHTMNIYFIAETNVLYQSIKIFLSYMNIETNYDLIKKNRNKLFIPV